MPFDTSDTQLKMKLGSTTAAYPQITTTPRPPLSYDSGLKRLVDVTLVALSAVVVVPVIALMALLVSLDGRAPFYTQLRVGRNGKAFRIIKMRTMVHNADALLQNHLSKDPALKAEWDATQKLKNDIRVTWIGRFLRKTSLDELPQLINVLMGSMSLVGPRPMMLSQQSLYPGQSYYRLRPGITGLWQISDRNACHFCDRAKYDAVYERTMSLKNDIKVLLQTVVVVLRGTGY
ncbi:sugar transferase [uncultured Roseobacter sp.]|uniref:sugar transferase n=1 Tax=uncultured Roseobacter sp. TaxID=114847 RepID=UPI002624856C|nr:sugar transferase [uncultured Roseobacter sp.]